MIETTNDEASIRFKSLIDRAIEGEMFVITREGRPVARLSPILPARDQAAEPDNHSRMFAVGNGTRFNADERQRWAQHAYPCTLVADRYTGVYSGGRWIAYPLHPEDVPFAVGGDDLTCSEFWWDHNVNDRLLPVGRGDTPAEAYDDLVAVMRGNPEDNPAQPVTSHVDKDSIVG